MFDISICDPIRGLSNSLNYNPGPGKIPAQQKRLISFTAKMLIQVVYRYRLMPTFYIDCGLFMVMRIKNRIINQVILLLKI